MPAPPSRASWIWQIAAAAAERAQQLGTELGDMHIGIDDLEGAFLVRIGDVNLGSYRNPAILASGTLPVAGSADKLRRDIRAAIGKELTRLRAPEPPPHWFESLAGSLAVWAGRVGVDLETMQLRLDADDHHAVHIHADDADGAEVVTLPLPAGVSHVDLEALARSVRAEVASQASAVRH